MNIYKPKRIIYKFAFVARRFFSTILRTFWSLEDFRARRTYELFDGSSPSICRCFLALSRHKKDLIIPKMTDAQVAMNIATISAGFEKGDFLVREEQGNRVYFDFFEEVSSLWSGVFVFHVLRLTLILFAFLSCLGLQLHCQQGIRTYVQRRWKTLGWPYECYPW